VECRRSRVCELLFLEEEEEVMATLTETNSAATFAIITEVLVIEKQVRSLPNSNGDSASVSFETWVEYVHVCLILKVSLSAGSVQVCNH